MSYVNIGLALGNGHIPAGFATARRCLKFLKITGQMAKESYIVTNKILHIFRLFN